MINISKIKDKFEEFHYMEVGFLFKFIFYSLVVVSCLIIFSPKKQIYYYVETIAKKQNIIISDENITNETFGVKLSNGKLYYDEIVVGSFENISIESFLFVSTIKIKNFTIDDLYKHFLPTKIDNITISHNIFKPFTLNLNSKGEFGEIEGDFDIKTKKQYIKLVPSKKMKNSQLLSMMKKTQNGYIYESK